MMRITLAPLAVAATRGGGISFIAGGFDLSNLKKDVAQASELIERADSPIPSREGVLPIGIGFQNWGSDLNVALQVVKEYVPAAVWFFAPRRLPDLLTWSNQIREVSGGKTKIWIQVCSVSEAVEAAKTSKPDVLVIQGTDAGGHGLEHAAGIVSLLPEVHDALEEEGITSIPLVAAGGIMDGRGMAAALTLGASGVALGTRFLAAEEATIARGYQDEVLRVGDGGVSTVRSTVYDRLREIKGWPPEYDGRGIVNESYLDEQRGLPERENVKLYKETMQMGDKGWGSQGRMTTYAGTGVGLVKKVMPAAEIIREIGDDVITRLRNTVDFASKA